MKSEPVSRQDIHPHSVWRLILLHLLPGTLILVLFVLAVPVVKSLSLPVRFATLMCIYLVLIPFELGVLLREGKKRNGKYSLQGIVLLREKIPVWQYFLFVPLLVAWSAALALLLSPVADFLVRTVFYWLPDYFIDSDISGYSRTTLIIMVTLYGIGNMGAAIVEELYFRGYLMPRLSRLKGWAPLVNTVK